MVFYDSIGINGGTLISDLPMCLLLGVPLIVAGAHNLLELASSNVLAASCSHHHVLSLYVRFSLSFMIDDPALPFLGHEVNQLVLIV
jgi:hypothetical protein